MKQDYQSFIATKKPKASMVGLSAVPELHGSLKEHQRRCVDFALRAGRCGLFLDTGLGKTFCQLEYLNHAANAEGGKVLLLTPLAVAKQIEREAHHWGYDAKVIREQSDATAKINICNYDRLHLIDASQFVAVSLDESSILKSFTGKTTRALINTFDGYRFKMAATATPAPNDHMELGQHAEFLNLMTAQEMLMRWFINDTATASQEWRLKGHAVQDFYDWMASWSRMASSPADMGCDATGYDLLPLNVISHRAQASDVIVGDGLFITQVSATNMHNLKRQTTGNRSDLAAEIALSDESPFIVWVDTDYEADAVKERIGSRAVEVRGSQKPETKEELLEAFSTGKANGIITKTSLAGYGLNWQHCNRMIFAGRNFSYENYYQGVRRCWRFGQSKTVDVHLIVAEGEDAIGRVIERKADDHASMKKAMSDAMARAMERTAEVKKVYLPTHNGRMPTWIR
jgi:Helicase conserved C-terminal domain